MAIALVQKGGSQATASGSSVTVSWSPGGSSTAGNLIAVLISSYSAATTTYTVTDQSGGNAFAQATDSAWDATWGIKSAVWYLANCPAGITGVKVATSSSAQPTIGIAEFSGALTASPLGPTSTATGSAATANSGNVTPADNGSLIFGGGVNSAYVNAANRPNTVGTSYTADYNSAASSAGLAAIAEHLVQATAAAIAVTFGCSASDNYWAHAAVFKPAAGGAVFVAEPPFILRQAVKRAAFY